MVRIRHMSIEEMIYVAVSILSLILLSLGVFSDYRIGIYVLMTLYFFAFFLTVKDKSFSLYQVFLITFFVFLLGRVFLACLGMVDITKLIGFKSAQMSNYETARTVNTLIVFLVGSSYAWMVSGRSVYDKYFNQKKVFSFNKPIKVLFYIYLMLFIGKMFFAFRLVLTRGYLVLFNGAMSEVKSPKIFNGAATITECMYIILMYYNRDKKSFTWYSGLLLIAGMVKMLTGQRGYGLILLMYVLFLYSRNYREIKITNWKIVGFGLIIPFVIQIIFNMRYKYEISIKEMIKSNIYFQVIQYMSGSIECVANTIIHNDEFTNKVPFLLGYFVDFFKKEPAGQVLEDITNGNYLGDHLTYIINSTQFFRGHGTGTSLVAETYSTFGGNLFWVFFFSFIECLFVFYIEKRAYKSLYIFAISYYLFTDFIYSPRNSIFKSLKDVVFVLAVCFVVQQAQNIKSSNHHFVAKS